MSGRSQILSTEFLGRLRAFVRRRVQTEADADDVVQDVLTRLVQHSATQTGSVHAWLFTVARNVIIDRGRTRRIHAGLDGLALAEEPSEPAAEASEELASCLEPMMSSLSAEDRHVLTRVDLRGESQADLARECGLSPSVIKSRVQRARKRLRAALENCCLVDRDGRGTPIAYQRRAGANCACGEERSGC